MVQISNTKSLTLHQRELWVYESLSRMIFLGYRSKIMLIVFFGIHAPLMALSVWLVVQPLFEWRTYGSIIGVILAATLAGTFITLLVLDHLLRPVLKTSKALRAYRETREQLPLPAMHSDEVGILMADAGRTIAHLEATRHELEQAIEMKNRFIAVAAHDLRQPSLALSLYAQNLIEYPHTHQEFLPKIATACAAINQMFESLFDLANLDSGTIVLKTQRVDVTELLTHVQIQLEPLATAKNIHLRVRKGHSVLKSDAARLQRMIGNVVSNAIKYSPPDRKILLAARPDRHGARIEIWDQGFGIPQADLSRIFEEFYRVNRPDVPESEGTGLGLSIASRLARVLNGHIDVRSEVGRGTRFRLYVGDIQSAPMAAAPLDVG